MSGLELIPLLFGAVSAVAGVGSLALNYSKNKDRKRNNRLHPLAKGWTELQDSGGKCYYYHDETKSSTYIRPVADEPRTSTSSSSDSKEKASSSSSKNNTPRPKTLQRRSSRNLKKNKQKPKPSVPPKPHKQHSSSSSSETLLRDYNSRVDTGGEGEYRLAVDDDEEEHAIGLAITRSLEDQKKRREKTEKRWAAEEEDKRSTTTFTQRVKMGVNWCPW